MGKKMASVRIGKRRKLNNLRMRLYKKILLALLIVFIAIQFIQPAHNNNAQLLATDITKTYHLPDEVCKPFLKINVMTVIATIPTIHGISIFSLWDGLWQSISGMASRI
ncbi:MAG: hypothetical protein WKF59_17725 [Chitinophagaceae bacterium]